MKKLFFALIAVATVMSVFACFNREGHGGFNFIYADSILEFELDAMSLDSCEIDTVVADSGYYAVADSFYTDTISLNDIRFSGWTEEDWWGDLWSETE